MKVLLFSFAMMFVLCLGVLTKKSSVLKQGGDIHHTMVQLAIMPQMSSMTNRPLLPSSPAFPFVTTNGKTTTQYEQSAYEGLVSLKPP